MIRSVRKPKLAFVIDPKKLDKFEKMVKDPNRKSATKILDEFDQKVKEMMEKYK